MPKLLHLIVACSKNRVIGRDGKLPWRIPEDLEFFHAETAGQTCVLGRICFETWPRAAKDGRRPVVVTSRPVMELQGHPGEDLTATTVAVPSLPVALATAETLPGDIYVCGGQRIYEEVLTLTRPMQLHLTLVHADVAGDTFFPEWRHLNWVERARRESADANYRYTFFTLDRV